MLARLAERANELNAISLEGMFPAQLFIDIQQWPSRWIGRARALSSVGSRRGRSPKNSVRHRDRTQRRHYRPRRLVVGPTNLADGLAAQGTGLPLVRCVGIWSTTSRSRKLTSRPFRILFLRLQCFGYLVQPHHQHLARKCRLLVTCLSFGTRSTGKETQLA